MKKKQITKKEVVQRKIDANIEEIYSLEIVRDYNREKGNQLEVDASVKRIMQNQENLKFLEEYIKTCE